MDRRVHRYPTQSEKSGTSEQVECSEDSSGDHYDPFSPETPIEKVIQWVVEEKIQSHIDYEPWVKTLKDNYITRRLHLSLLERRSLEKLNLPILVESILGNLCSDQVTKTKTKSISKLKMPTTPKAILHTSYNQTLKKLASKSSNASSRNSTDYKTLLQGEEITYFGIGETERESISLTWHSVLDKYSEDEKLDDNSFYSIFWENWVRTDEKAKELFKLQTKIQKVNHITKVMNFIMKAAEEPKTVLSSFSKLSVPHCIWAIQPHSYNAFGLAVVEALELSLGQHVMTEGNKEAWLTIITELGDRIVEHYDSVKRGWSDVLLKKQGNVWKKYFTKLTEDTLYLYKSEMMKKSTEKFVFNLAKDVSMVPDESSVNPPNQYCFYIQFGTVKKYFCASSPQNLKDWVDNVIWRIKAYTRLSDGKTEMSNLTDKDPKKLNEVLSAPLMDSKKEKDSKKTTSKRKNLKQEKIRNHLDAQIKKQADFSLFDSLIHPTIVIDTAGKIIYINSATIETTGYEPGQLVGSNVKKLMTSKDAMSHDEYIRKYLVTGESHIIGMGRYVILRHKSGTEISCFLTVTEHKQTGNTLFIGTITEGEEGVSSTEPSSTNENMFHAFDNLLQSTIVISSDGVIEYCNRMTCKLTGYSEDEFVGKPINILMESETAAKHDSYIKSYLETGVSSIIGIGRDIHFINKAGKSIAGRLEVTKHLWGRDNKKVSFIGTLTKKEDETLDSFVQSHANVLQYLDVPICAIGENGVVLLFNKAAENAFGYKESDIVGKNVNILMTKSQAKKHNSYIQNYLLTGKAKIIGRGRVVNVLAQNGNVRQCHLAITERVSGSLRFFVGILAVLY